ncbi:MAG: hypothetical protein M1827_001896 [Pycnora praestabilis]|nr:MAG: hypothetical protein M1827_001896 [Pycnora praestabilis]
MSISSPLHLLRALLRECTYLPDPASRTWVQQHILSRYKAYTPSTYKYRKAPQSEISPHRNTQLIRKSNKALSYLRRANAGELKPLQNILGHTYGRTGRRRRQLLKPLTLPDTPSDNAAVEALREGSRKGIPVRSVKLQALMRSQQNQRFADTERLQVKSLRLEMPEKNIWGRPLPARRKRNINRKWYAMVLDRTLPPLPENEWNMLRAKATGVIAWGGIVERRARPKDENEDENTTSLLTREFLGQPLGKELYLPSTSRKDQPHQITPRLMRRLWSRIFAQSPVMRWDALEGRWQVRWGSISDERSPLQSLPWGLETLMFTGVDDMGRLPQSPPSSRALRRMERAKQWSIQV